MYSIATLQTFVGFDRLLHEEAIGLLALSLYDTVRKRSPAIVLKTRSPTRNYLQPQNI
ncbi:hypothetical protein [Baaleninema simplex]|uniref:hypothetical protein n=1 Tax=Baaleninema simplex TaxID=2862350 RepID=UPI00034B9DF4|nr:hypothetical protein [Baaleninema simplex]